MQAATTLFSESIGFTKILSICRQFSQLAGHQRVCLANQPPLLWLWIRF